MEWTQFIIFFLGVFGLWLWNRAESRADIRQMDGKMEAWRSENNAILKAIQEEMKDFHKRLCEIEAKRTGG